MKRLSCVVALFALCAQAGTVGGPKGGKLLEAGNVRAEFFVNESRHAEVIFYDENLGVVAPGEQTVIVLAGADDGRKELEMTRGAGGFVSSGPLPEGDGYRIVVRVKASADAGFVNFRIDYHSALCGGCDRGEYACICDHAGEEDHGHSR